MASTTANNLNSLKHTVKVAMLVICMCFTVNSCNESVTSVSADSNSTDSAKTAITPLPDSIAATKEKIQDPCAITYDTITNPNYLAHKNIMERYFTPGKRAYSTIGKDTMDTWLYPQDIGVFFQELDSTEQGMYRMMTNKIVFMMTNKIVFMMLNHDACTIIFTPYNELQKHYFLWQVAHPLCIDSPMDSTIARVERNMNTKTPEMKKFKAEVIASLEKNRQ